MTSVTANTIAALLPQTQCRQCGFDGCVPYAEALSRGQADINLCPPGGTVVMHDLSRLLQRPPQALAQADKAAMPKALAQIDEAECIGCTACIKACPVDAIVGATKQMHTVLADECTGCELCLPPCPVDCIRMVPVDTAWLPQSHTLAADGLSERAAAAEQARERHHHKMARLRRLAATKAPHLTTQKALLQNQPQTADTTMTTTPTADKINSAARIAQAMARAQSLQAQRREPGNQAEFQQQQIAKAQERARYRRAVHDLQYGDDAEKSAALAYLREDKARREAQQQTNPSASRHRHTGSPK